MSYILDALRKSDLQRQRGTAPTLLTTHVTAEPPKQPPVLLYGMLAVALIGAGMVIGWLQPWQTQQPVPAPAPAPAPAPVTLESVRTPERELPAQKPVTAAQPAAVPVIPNAETSGTAPKAPVRVPSKAVATIPEKPAARPAEPTQEPSVLTISELPLAIQQSLPRMSISVHAYSPKVQDRVVMINNRMMREGQDLIPGLRLEQITPDGMIFSFGGYRFRRVLQQSGESAEIK